MSRLIKLNAEYAEWIHSLSNRFRQSRIKAAVSTNSLLLKFYWSIGKDIAEREMENAYGSDFFRNLSLDLKDLFPGVKGFSPRNLAYMKSFYLLYNPYIKEPLSMDIIVDSSALIGTSENLQQVAANLEADLFCIPWGHHMVLINKFMGQPKKAIFFVHKTIENGWSRSVLENFIDIDLYERQGKALTNFSHTLPPSMSDLAQEITKDPYIFDYAQIREHYDETELKQALMSNVRKLLLEFGSGFAFMGSEYRLTLGDSELFCDMLFYNTQLHSYVVIEIKTRKFEASDLGQLSGYVSCVNHLLKRNGDNDTIGLLICKSKDEVMARYFLENYTQPLGISEYELSKVFPDNFKSSLPTIEDIENELKLDKN